MKICFTDTYGTSFRLQSRSWRWGDLTLVRLNFIWQAEDFHEVACFSKVRKYSQLHFQWNPILRNYNVRLCRLIYLRSLRRDHNASIFRLLYRIIVTNISGFALRISQNHTIVCWNASIPLLISIVFLLLLRLYF